MDGVLAYLRNGTTALNSPTNFAGVMGQIDVAPCDDGLDNDGDGAIDVGVDPGCASALDPDGSERDSTGSYLCDDGDDDDGDTFADFPDDPACRDPSWPQEASQCQDGLNNDGQLGTDFDGGESIHGVGNGDPDGADLECTQAWVQGESPSCGLGYELALVLGALALLRRRAAAARTYS